MDYGAPREIPLEFHSLNLAKGPTSMMRFVPRDRTDLQVALERLPDDMPVEIGASVGVIAVNVAALREVEDLPQDIVVGIPAQRLPSSVVKVDRLGDSFG